jgi:predicted transcriptional regulator
MTDKSDLTPVELELMNILWQIGHGTVRDVMDLLPRSRDLAYTSVSTILRILEQKKILTTKKVGRQHIYLPTLSKKKFAAHSVTKIVNQIFSGNSAELVACLVDKHNFSNEEIATIQKLLNDKKKELA